MNEVIDTATANTTTDSSGSSLHPYTSYFPPTIDDRFQKFHAANPHVYRMLVEYCHHIRAAGKTKYSMDAIFHRLRWHYRIELRTVEPFTLNDDYTSRYARLLMEQEPEFRGMFELRLLREPRTM